MGVVGRLDQYASMLASEFDDYSMSENLLTYSEQFDNTSGWNITSGVSVSANTTIAPDGTLTADTVTITGGSHALRQLVSVTQNTQYTFSFYVKRGTATALSYSVYNWTTLSEFISPTSYYSQTSASSWARISVTFITPSGCTSIQVYPFRDGSATGTAFVWGAQLERGSVPTDYTPTTTTAINRVLASTTNTNITGLGTYYSSGFDENVGFTTFLSANIFPPYDLVYDEFGGTLFGAGQGRYKRQNTDKSVIVYNEIDEITDFRDIVRTGLVLDLDAGMNASYNGSGTTWTDLSGTGNTGTLVNTPTYNSSGYFDFDYLQSESVSFNSSSSLQFLNTSPYTLEAWVYPTRNSGTGNYTGIFDRESNPGSGRDGYNMYFLGSATTNTFFFTERFTSGSYNPVSVTLNQSVSVNSWHHIVATYNGTTLTLYRNGSSVGTPATTTGNITNTSKTLTIGVRGGQYFGGRIANTKIYNRSLTASEIQQNYNATKSRFGL